MAESTHGFRTLGSEATDLGPIEPRTLLQLNNGRLPNEIISEVISKVVDGGIQISKHPTYNSDITAIRALLKTSIAIKQETLRQIYLHPLCFYITTGHDCGCKMVDLEANTRMEPELFDATADIFSHAFFCIRRQSGRLSNTLRQLCNIGVHDIEEESKPDTRNESRPARWAQESDLTNLTVTFAETQFMSLVNQGRVVPLWDVKMLLGILEPWRWDGNRTVGQLSLPSAVSATFRPFLTRSQFIRQSFISKPQAIADKIWHDFEKWWSSTNGFSHYFFPWLWHSTSETAQMYLAQDPDPFEQKMCTIENGSMPTLEDGLYTFGCFGILHIGIGGTKEGDSDGAGVWKARTLAFKANEREKHDEYRRTLSSLIRPG